MSDQPTDNAVVIERIFDAPIDLVWQLWTEPEHFKNWYAPHGFNVPVAEMDVRVGGKRLVCMERQSDEGQMMFWTAGEYTDVMPTERLVYTDSMSDENGNLIAPPNDDQPMITTVTVELESVGDRTKMVMTHAGLPETEGANMGWKQAFDKLATRLESIMV